MTALALLALLLPIAAAALLLPDFPRGNGDRFDALVARVATATGIGLGMSSTAFFLSLLLFDGKLWSVLLFDLVTLAIAVAAWRSAASGALQTQNALGDHVPLRPAETPPAPPHRSSLIAHRSPSSRTRFSSILSLLFVVVFLACLIGFVLTAIREPHGQWDAWAIWNAKARFLARAGAGWRIALSKETVTPDYPLLLPGAIARAWSYAGAEPPLVAIVVAALFAIAAIALAVSALSILRGRGQGMLGGLLVAPFLLAQAGNLYADVPLSFSVLAAVVLLALHDRFDPTGKSLPLLAGLAAGMAAWTKNEGVVFLLVTLGIRSFWTLFGAAPARWASLLWFSLASVPFLVLNATLRLWLLESATTVTFLRWEAVGAQLFDPVRYGKVLATVAGHATPRTLILPLLVVVGALLGLCDDRELRRIGRIGLSVLVLMLAAFLAAYVVTPHDLAWHVSTTLDRLVIQITPLAVFAVLMVAASPEERQSVVAVARRTRGSRREKKR